jgi:hypothetical protein
MQEKLYLAGLQALWGPFPLSCKTRPVFGDESVYVEAYSRRKFAGRSPVLRLNRRLLFWHGLSSIHTFALTRPQPAS